MVFLQQKMKKKKAWILQLSKVIKSNFVVLWEEKEES
jgi:hypothetical protein